MYAVIANGGKQYKVAAGDRLKLEKMPGDVGQEVIFDQVLMLGEAEGVKVGDPLVKGAKVTAEITNIGRHRKVKILKFRRRKHHMKQAGHRQHYVEVKIKDIKG